MHRKRLNVSSSGPIVGYNMGWWEWNTMERVGDKQAAAATLDCPGGLCLPAWEDGDDRLSNSMF